MGHDLRNPAFFGPSFLLDELYQQEEIIRRAERQRAEDASESERLALQALAEEACPPDVVRLGENIKCPELARIVWQNAFIAGWRAMHAYHRRREREGDRA